MIKVEKFLGGLVEIVVFFINNFVDFFKMINNVVYFMVGGKCIYFCSFCIFIIFMG